MDFEFTHQFKIQDLTPFTPFTFLTIGGKTSSLLAFSGHKYTDPLIKQTAPIITNITKLAKQNSDIAAIWLYGSRAQERARPNSDYDLAIAFHNFSLDALARYSRPHSLALDWAALLGLPEQQLSLVDINQVPVYLAYQIIDTGQLIYSDGSARSWQEITRINSLFEYQQRESNR